MLKLFSLLVLFIGALTLKDEQTIDLSPMISDEISNDEENAMELADYEQIYAILDARNDAKLVKRQTFLCEILKGACRAVCSLIPIGPLREACFRVCNFVDKFPSRAQCVNSCGTLPLAIVRRTCVRACRLCLRNRRS